MNVNIELHYSITNITIEYRNPVEVHEEVLFDAVIPENAFVTGLDMYVRIFFLNVNYIAFAFSFADGTWYTSHIATKEQAEMEYDEGKDTTSTGSLVFFSGIRDANAYSVSVYIRPFDTVIVVMKYEELLKLDNNTYSWILNQYLTEIVPDFSFNVFIKEGSAVENVTTTALAGNNNNQVIPLGMKIG